MSRQLAQAFISNGIASYRRTSQFLYSFSSRSVPIFTHRLSSSSASSSLQDGGSNLGQAESCLRSSPGDDSRLCGDVWRPVDSEGSKTRHQTSQFDTEIRSQNMPVASKEGESHHQKTPVRQQSITEDQAAGTLPSENHSLLSSSDSAERGDATIEPRITSDTSSYTKSDRDQQSLLADQNAVPLYNQELQKGRMQESRKAHFLDALRAKNIIDLAEKPAVNKQQRALKHDEIRSKDTWSFDWSVPLFELRDALPEQRLKTSKKSLSFTSALKSENISLIDNDYVGVPVSSIPTPKIWTKASFAQHVHDLSRSRMPRQFDTSADSPKSASHQTMVCKRLEEVMFLPENATLVTSAALNSAIRFYYRYGLLPSVQRLYFYMKKINHPSQDTTIDTMLRYAARDKDLHNFTSLLLGARTQGFVPSEMTWVSLLLCLLSNESRELVLNLMHQHELLQSKQTRQDVAFVRLEMALARTLDMSDIPKLIDQMDTQCGQDWLTIRSANTLLKELCQSPAGQPITDFLDLMVKRGCMPNIDSMNILLQRCRRVTDLEAALEVLDRFANSHSVVPDQTSYTLLFRTAWDSRNANTCKILWAAACVHKRVAYPIQQLIKTSLLKTKPTSISHAYHRWKWHAGKLVVGIDPRQNVSNSGRLVAVQSRTKVAVFPSTASMKAVMALTPEDDKTQGLRKSYAQALIQHDESLHKQFYYTLGSIRAQLAEAYKMDEEWKASSINTSPLECQTRLMIKPLLQWHRNVSTDPQKEKKDEAT